MRKVLERCPSCGGDLEVTRLSCTHCETVVTGRFQPCRFCKLPPASGRPQLAPIQDDQRVIAEIASRRAEDAFRQSMLLSQGNLSIFVGKPLVALLTLSAVAVLVVPAFMTMRRRTRMSATGPA